MDTSSALTGSSQTRKRGFKDNAFAIPILCLWPPENSPDPVALAGGTMSEEDTHKLEQRLQQQYAEYGMELQVVTLTHSVLVLFSGEGSTIGLHYDPVLETWSGIAIQ